MTGIGVLGAANIANKNIRAIGLADGAEVVAVGSRDRSKAAALLERWGLSGSATAYGSYAEVLADPRVDAVYIPLPTSLHLEWVKNAAAAGKSILLEKPVAVNDAELDAMLEACRAAGVQLMDGTMWMHNPRTARMAAVLHDTSAVGTLKEVNSTFTFTGTPDFLQGDIRMKADCDPLGALGDLGWYCIRAILWAFDFEPPIAVAAHAGASFSPEGVPVHMGGTLVFAGGRRGHFQCGFDRALTQYLEVAGTEGTIRTDDFVLGRAEKQCSFTITSEHCLKDYDVYDGTQRDEVTVSLPKAQEALMWETFCRLVERVKAGGQPDPHWPAVAELTQQVLLAVDRSAREGGRQVELSLA